MLPALRPGDWLIAWRTRRIRPGQVVLAWHPSRPGFLLVKRAVRQVQGDGKAGGGWWLESDFPEAPGAVGSNRFGPVPGGLIVARVLVRYLRPGRARRLFLFIPNVPCGLRRVPHPPRGCGTRR